MAQFITLDPALAKPLRSVDPRLMSYNVEMAEVTGGTFWKEYTPGQIAGTEEFPKIKSITDPMTMKELVQYYPPIDLYNERLRKLTKALGPAWIRVSGSWATKTYYDFEGTTGGKVPEGFQNILTKEQWIGVLDFVRDMDGKLLVSVGNCTGNHPDDGPLDLSQAKLLFDFSAQYGVPIAAAEFMNEPNALAIAGVPKGYGPEDYVRDHDLFNAWVRENYPDCILVGPCTTGGASEKSDKGGVANMMFSLTTDELLKGAQIPLDVFSYHFYSGGSDRIASVMPEVHWDPAKVHTDEYLSGAVNIARVQSKARDRYVPNGPMWVTEAGDAGGGGNSWASTYLDVLRTLNELGSFCTVTEGVIFHNTLAASDYGFLRHGSFDPRPNYFAVWLWNNLMGTRCYDCGDPNTEGAHVYCHSRRDGKEGKAYLVINNSLTDITTVSLPGEAEVYTLAGRDGARSTVMTLNGHSLLLGEHDELPDLVGEHVCAESIELAPLTCTFIVV